MSEFCIRMTSNKNSDCYLKMQLKSNAESEHENVNGKAVRTLYL